LAVAALNSSGSKEITKIIEKTSRSSSVGEFWLTSIEHRLSSGIFFTEEFKEIEVYNDICIKDICVVVEEPYFAHHLIAILDIFHENVPDSVGEIVKLLNKPEEFSQKLEEITDEDVKTKLAFLMRIHTKHKSASFGDNLKDIESTTLGKLAKEIMGDLNIEEIQQSMNEQNGNIFESFKNPNSGLGKVLSSVSQKMLSKIGSGELNQESLLTDAIDLAGKLPNLMPEGMGSQLGNIGEMLAQLQKMSKSKTGENPMDMMQEMMNGMNLNKAQKGRANSHMKSSINKSKIVLFKKYYIDYLLPGSDDKILVES
jgi:hypothetical protein